jgi:tetratricopeptide (TPR) repeat protein
MTRQQSQLQGAKMQAATFPNDVRLQMVAGNLSREAGDHEGACKYYYAAITIGLPIDGRFEFYFDFGDSLRRIGNLDDAEEIFRTAIEEFPSDKGYPVFLAQVLHQAGKHDQAMMELLHLMIRLRDKVIDFAKHKPEILKYMKELGVESVQPDLGEDDD